jgi:phosphatidylglycerol:prolipoprotein diacylglycerol transferase
LPFPNFNPVLIQIGPIAIRWYALAYIAGILVGWRYGVALVRNTKIWKGTRPPVDERQIDDLVLWITLAILIGGRMGSVLFYNTSILWTNPLEVFQPWHGGMSFHGALLAVTGVLIWFARRHRIDLLKLADLVAPCVPFGLFFGRIANFINGELWGRPTTAPWGIVFPRAILSDGSNPPRHPSELYEAGLEGIALFIILRIATHVSKLLPRRGAVVGLFLAFYGLFRIVLENVREPDRDMPHFPLGLTMGIMLSVPMVVVGLGLLWWSSRPQALAQAWEPALDEGDDDLGEADTTLGDVPEGPSDPFPAPTPEPL